MILHVELKKKEETEPLINNEVEFEIINSFTPTDLWVVCGSDSKTCHKVQQWVDCKYSCKHDGEEIDIYVSGVHFFSPKDCGLLTFRTCSIRTFVDSHEVLEDDVNPYVSKVINKSEFLKAFSLKDLSETPSRFRD